MLTKRLLLVLTLVLINISAFSYQNPTFKEKKVIFRYIDRPRHYSERAETVKIHLINKAVSFERSLDLTRVSPNTWKIEIPFEYLFRDSGITKYTYYYYFVVDGKKILDPANNTRTMEYDAGINGKISFFRIENRVPAPFMIMKNPHIMPSGFMFYYPKEPKSKKYVKLIITNMKDFTRVYKLIKNAEGILYAFVPKSDLPGRSIHIRLYYKFIVNGLYELDPLNPNQHRSPLKGIFNIVENKDPLFGNEVILKSPNVSDRGLIFYCKAPGASKVGLLTSLNNWKKILPMSKSSDPRLKGYWQILLSKKDRNLPLMPGKYKYKFVIDGVITYDEVNPDYDEDGLGGKVSVFTLKKPINYYGTNPVHIKGNIYRFFFMSRKAKRVFLAGSFNNFNPFDIRLKRVNEDLFIADVTLHPGRYYYNFVVDNKWLKDPRNTNAAFDQTGRRVSIVLIKRTFAQRN